MCVRISHKLAGAGHMLETIIGGIYRVSGKRTRKYFDVRSESRSLKLPRFYRAVFVTNSSDSSEKMRIIVKSKRAAR